MNYKIGDILLLQLMSSQPILWWFALNRIGVRPPFDPTAYVAVSAFGCIVATYSISIHFDPYLGRGPNAKVERFVRYAMNLLILSLVPLVCWGLPVLHSSVDVYILSIFYGLSIGLLFFVHYLVFLRSQFNLKKMDNLDYVVESSLSINTRKQAKQIVIIILSITLGAFATWFTFMLIQYVGILPEHITMFQFYLTIIYPFLFKTIQKESEVDVQNNIIT